MVYSIKNVFYRNTTCLELINIHKHYSYSKHFIYIIETSTYQPTKKKLSVLNKHVLES